jgi:endogenous inhibitor of DNA gyrase (YacG/DUF329 family)
VELAWGVLMKCPICRQDVAWEGNPNRPFCSERCRLIDLGNWASEKYSLPSEEVNPAENSIEEHNVET